MFVEQTSCVWKAVSDIILCCIVHTAEKSAWWNWWRHCCLRSRMLPYKSLVNQVNTSAYSTVIVHGWLKVVQSVSHISDRPFLNHQGHHVFSVLNQDSPYNAMGHGIYCLAESIAVDTVYWFSLIPFYWSCDHHIRRHWKYLAEKDWLWWTMRQTGTRVLYFTHVARVCSREPLSLEECFVDFSSQWFVTRWFIRTSLAIATYNSINRV